MPKFMLLLGGADLDKRSGGPGTQEMMVQYQAWMKKLIDGGHYHLSHKLKDQGGTRLTVRGGEVVDGPFIETKEAVGGMFVIEAADLAEATGLSRDCPVLLAQNGYIEVRAVEL
ncbi:MAG: YciI family protein [Kofleriaceae bacterium]